MEPSSDILYDLWSLVKCEIYHLIVVIIDMQYVFIGKQFVCLPLSREFCAQSMAVLLQLVGVQYLMQDLYTKPMA